MAASGGVLQTSFAVICRKSIRIGTCLVTLDTNGKASLGIVRSIVDKKKEILKLLR